MSKTKQLEELTAEQIAKFPEYVEKWINIGTNTDRLDTKETEEIVRDFRTEILELEDAPLVFCKNPIEAWVMCVLFQEGVTPENLQEEMVKVFHGNPEKHKIPPGELPYQTGSFLASVFSFYDYFIEETDLEFDKELLDKYLIWQRTSKIGMVYPFPNLTIVCEKPSVVKLNEENQLHCDGGPALAYEGEGEYVIYALNGVVVPKYLAVTPSGQLDLKFYHNPKKFETVSGGKKSSWKCSENTEGADIKAEFVRKYGIERMLDMGKKVDTFENYPADDCEWWWKSEYELWDMNCLFESIDYAPHLKMLNQTTGVWHVEAVSPECNNLRDALRERLGGDFVIEGIA